MNSTFVLTIRCLIFSAIIAGGCMIAETIDFNFDFSGTKTIEFPYRDGKENILQRLTTDNIGNQNKSQFTLAYIDSAFQWVDNVSNLKIDTSDFDLAKISFDFNAEGPQIKDKVKYNYFNSKLPEELQWYFEHRPNMFNSINKNQLIWKAADIDQLKMGLREHLDLSEHLKSVETITTLNFPRKIKNVSSDRIIISPDRKTLKTKVDLSEVANLDRMNEVLITFEH